MDQEDYNLDSINKWKKNKANRWFNRKYGFGILQADKLLGNAEGFTSLGNYDDRKIIEYDHSFTNKPQNIYLLQIILTLIIVLPLVINYMNILLIIQYPIII